MITQSNPTLDDDIRYRGSYRSDYYSIIDEDTEGDKYVEVLEMFPWQNNIQFR